MRCLIFEGTLTHKEMIKLIHTIDSNGGEFSRVDHLIGKDFVYFIGNDEVRAKIVSEILKNDQLSKKMS